MFNEEINAINNKVIQLSEVKTKILPELYNNIRNDLDYIFYKMYIISEYITTFMNTDKLSRVSDSNKYAYKFNFTDNSYMLLRDPDRIICREFIGRNWVTINESNFTTTQLKDILTIISQLNTILKNESN